MCNCSVVNCDHANGCIQSLEEYTQSASHFDYKTVQKEWINDVSMEKDYSDITPLNDRTTTCTTLNQERETINSLTFALIGLLIVAFIIVFAYFYTRLLEKRFKVTRIV